MVIRLQYILARSWPTGSIKLRQRPVWRREDHPRPAGKGENARLQSVLYAVGRRGAGTEGPLQAQGFYAVVKGIADIGVPGAFESRNDHHYDWPDFRIYRRNKRETIPLVCPPIVDCRTQPTRRNHGTS